MTSLGKFRHLTRCSTADQRFVILAIDHRANLLKKLNESAASPLDDAAFTAFKQLVIDILGEYVSGILVDPAYGIGPGIASGRIGREQGILSPIEITDYDLHPSQRPIEMITGWSVEKIKLVGCDGVKLLLPYHPDSPDADEKQAFVEQVAEDCARFDIPFFLEPIAFALSPEDTLSTDELRQVSVVMASTFSEMGVDILKMQFPVNHNETPDLSVWRAACEELDAACRVPWTLLSAGVDYATFLQQAKIACEKGASGVIVGRAVWAEAVEKQDDDREDFLHTIAVARLRELNKVVRPASPWTVRTGIPASPPDWYEDYFRREQT